MKSKSMAVALTFLLGATGVQWFYLRSPVVGGLWFGAFCIAILMGGVAPSFSGLVLVFLGLIALVHALWMATLDDSRFNAEHNPDFARCQQCSEVIQRAARKCKHCGAEFEATAPWVKPRDAVAQQPYDDSHLVH